MGGLVDGGFDTAPHIHGPPPSGVTVFFLHLCVHARLCVSVCCMLVCPLLPQSRAWMQASPPSPRPSSSSLRLLP